jgi:chromosome segregation ATPase
MKLDSNKKGHKNKRNKKYSIHKSSGTTRKLKRVVNRKKPFKQRTMYVGGAGISPDELKGSIDTLEEGLDDLYARQDRLDESIMEIEAGQTQTTETVENVERVLQGVGDNIDELRDEVHTTGVNVNQTKILIESYEAKLEQALLHQEREGLDKQLGELVTSSESISHKHATLSAAVDKLVESNAADPAKQINTETMKSILNKLNLSEDNVKEERNRRKSDDGGVNDIVARRAEFEEMSNKYIAKLTQSKG